MSIFAAARYARDVKLIVQGSTIDPRDKESFAEIMRTYANDKRIEFWPYSLKGAQWQQAIADMDAILMPYSAPRYRYQCSGMLFTALGSEKPVVTSDDLNPEVFQKYKVGATFKSGDMQELARCVEDFINTFDAKAALYSRELSRAAQDFAPENLVGQLLELANLKNAD